MPAPHFSIHPMWSSLRPRKPKLLYLFSLFWYGIQVEIEVNAKGTLSVTKHKYRLSFLIV